MSEIDPANHQRLLDEIEQLKADLERERVAHAGCLTFAEGGGLSEPWNRDVWAWSPANDAVRNLRLKFDEQTSSLATVQRELTEARAQVGELTARLEVAREAYQAGSESR